MERLRTKHLSHREPNLSDLERWLKDCVESEFNPYAIAARPKNSVPAGPRHHTSMNTSIVPPAAPSKPQSSSSGSLVSVCLICSMDHHLTKCKDYLLKTPEERYDFVKQHRLCFNCLDSRHRIAECKSKGSCKVTDCGIKHHTTLHRKKPVSSLHVNNVVGQVHSTSRHSSKVYFQVFPVVAVGRNGRKILPFVLLD